MATSGRVILHLDLDCFYCQVEQKRLNIPREVPAAVQQWDGLIAINYAARALGITRHMRVQEAMRKCAELQCIHVQTLGGETGQEGVAGPVNAGAVHPNDRSLQKACLERYRRASAEIIAVVRQMLPQVKIEKASIDEVYLDVTSLVEKELAEREDAAVSEHASVDAFAWGSIVEGGPLDTESEYDRRLSVGASIACRVRGAVRERLDFTCSAGIAQNKLLAKVGSARNKPNQQTIVAARGIEGLMRGLPLKKLRNFGGKLGAELQAMGATTAGEVAGIPLKQLQERFGDRAQWILNCVRGLQDEPVTVRELSKSMLAAKSFEATSDLTALARWLGILADELADRMVTDVQLNQRFPRLLVLSYRPKDQAAGRSRSVAMPRAPAPGPTAAQLKEAALGVLQRCPDALPCCNLGLTATEFQDAPGDEQGCITRFFQPRAGKEEQAEPPAGPPAESKASREEQTRLRRPHPPQRIETMFKAAATKGAAVAAAASSADGRPSGSPQPGGGGAGDGETTPAGTESHGSGPRESSGGQSAANTSDAQPPEELGGLRAVRHEAETAQHSTAETPAVREWRLHVGGRPVAQLRPRAGGLRPDGAPGSRTAVEAVTDARSPPEPESSAGGAEAPLDGVDLEEQKRILRDIWVRKSMARAPAERDKRRGPASHQRGGPPKQPRMTDLFMRKQK